MNTNIETCLWGTRNGDEDWQEQLLSTNPDRFEEIKKLATKDGFGRFRVVQLDLRVKPDFRKTINR